MEDKYYTPESKDLHIGFKYEVASVNSDWYITNWTKKVFNQGDLTSTFIKYPGHYRIKYLDKEDIESLGFVHTGGRLIKNNVDIFSYKKDSFFEYVLKYNYSFNKLEVYKEDLNYFEAINNCLFDGTIKNISEFKVLLKQLNVLTSSI